MRRAQWARDDDVGNPAPINAPGTVPPANAAGAVGLRYVVVGDFKHGDRFGVFGFMRIGISRALTPFTF